MGSRMRESDQHTDDQWHEHLRVIERFRQAFTDGEIGADKKRRLIADENFRYYGPGKVPAGLRARGAA